MLAITLALSVGWPVVGAQDGCPPVPPPTWSELVSRTNKLLEETRAVFSEGAIAISPASTESNCALGLDWLHLETEWREVEIPAEREIIQFSANRMAGHLTTTFTQLVHGEHDLFQFGKTAEAMDAYTTATSVFVLVNLGCGLSETY